MIDTRALARLFLLDFLGATGLMFLLAWALGLQEPLAWAVLVGVVSAVQALYGRHLKPRRKTTGAPIVQ